MTPAAEKTGRRKRSEAQQQHTEDMAANRAEAFRNAKELLNNAGKVNRETPRYNNPHLIAYKLAAYIEQCRQQERPLTEAGLQVATGLDRNQYKAYLNGERNYIYEAGLKAQQSEADIQRQLEHYKSIVNIQDIYHYLIGDEVLDNSNIIENKALDLSTPFQKARQLISAEREERLAKSGKVADIYTMKAREGEDWQEAAVRTEHVIDIKQVNAISALELLGYSKE